MSARMSLASLLDRVPAEVVTVVVDVVRAIVGSKDPKGAARRAEEAARRGAVDAALRKAKPRSR